MYMDKSGLGNVVFGYFTVRVNVWLPTQLLIGTIMQGINEDSAGQFIDNPDDISQVQLGNAIAEYTQDATDVSAELVMTLAETVGLR